MRVSVVNAKGGSGRTTVAYGLACDLKASIWQPRCEPHPFRSHRYDDIDELRGPTALGENVVIEGGTRDVGDIFTLCRLADVVVVPTRLDFLSIVSLREVTLPIVEAANTPAVLYAFEPADGDGRPDPSIAAQWDDAVDWFKPSAVTFAEWHDHGNAFADPTILATAAPLLPRSCPTETGCSLYRHLNADGRLLYVGISGDPVFRYRYGHADKAWAHQVATVDVEQFPYRWMARQAELVAIARERPLHNIADRVAWDDDNDPLDN